MVTYETGDSNERHFFAMSIGVNLKMNYLNGSCQAEIIMDRYLDQG